MQCVLAAIITVALRGMFAQLSDVAGMWAESRPDALVWVVTFVSVVVLDIDYGLLVGIVASLLLLIQRNQTFHIALLGRVKHTDIFLDKSRYSTVSTQLGRCCLNWSQVALFCFQGLENGFATH